MANVWASWCGPCRLEFPILQKLSARYGKQVAFVGVNSQDSDDAASTFLEEAPVSYPSYTDPDGKIADSLGTDGRPARHRLLRPRRRTLVYLKQGQYAAISTNSKQTFRRYALRKRIIETMEAFAIVALVGFVLLARRAAAADRGRAGGDRRRRPDRRRRRSRSNPTPASPT